MISDDKIRNEYDELVKKCWADRMAAMKQDEAKTFAANYATEITPQQLAEYRVIFDTIDLGEWRGLLCFAFARTTVALNFFQVKRPFWNENSKSHAVLKGWVPARLVCTCLLLAS